MYRDAELRKYQYYLHLTWSGVFFTLFLEFTPEIILLQVVFMQVPRFLDLGMQFFPRLYQVHHLNFQQPWCTSGRNLGCHATLGFRVCF